MSLPSTSSANGEAAEPRKSRRKSHGSGSVKGGTQELSIEERLDLQLASIMRSKSKLAIAMERVSADMHIKKRDREIVKLRKEIAECTHQIHKQKESIIAQDEAAKDMQLDYKNLQKRNFKLLQKQRQHLLPPLYLPYISPVSPLYLI